MDNSSLLKLMKDLDRAPQPRHRENPDGFDYREARKRFLAFVPALNAALGVACEVTPEDRVQDCSFHGEIVLPSEVVIDWDPTILTALRFSNFGNFVAVVSEVNVRRNQLPLIGSTLAEYGYVYVPDEVLEEPYDGDMAPDIRSWHVRFFDYL
jgi:hypothetical protein